MALPQRLATEIHNQIIGDGHFYESIQQLHSVSEVVLLLLQFLELRLSLRRQLSYDNVYPVFLEVVQTLRPHLPGVEQSVYYATYFIKQDFLHENLRRKKRIGRE